MPIKLFFLINALVWTGYGILCLLVPGMLSGEVVTDLIVFDLTEAVAKTEVRAMYGGVQLAIGLFAALVLLKQLHQRTALLFYLLLFAGLTFSRAAGLLIDGPSFSYSFSDGFTSASYNAGALWVFELPMFIYAAWLQFFYRGEN